MPVPSAVNLMPKCSKCWGGKECKVSFSDAVTLRKNLRLASGTLQNSSPTDSSIMSWFCVVKLGTQLNAMGWLYSQPSCLSGAITTMSSSAKRPAFQRSLIFSLYTEIFSRCCSEKVALDVCGTSSRKSARGLCPNAGNGRGTSLARHVTRPLKKTLTRDCG